MTQIKFLREALPQDRVQPLVGEMCEPDREVGGGPKRAASVVISIAIASVTLGNAPKLFRLTP
jgi:hypothetical protein